MNRRLLVALLVALALVALFAAVALASPTGTKQVGLVVGFPDGSVHVEIVTAPITATTFDVLRSAKIDLASEDTAFGPAICGINATGCPATDCFCDAAHFWAYYHLSSTGNMWTSASEGVGAYVPADRAVEGLAWSGFDASYNPTVQPPVYTFDQILAATSPAPVVIPEPATLLLLGAGLAGFAGYVRRTRGK